MATHGGRTLLTGWFSFVEGETTAGDVLALRRVQQVLGRVGVPYDVAWSPRFRPGGLALADARPSDYARLIFVCGPLHGPQVARLHRRYAQCHRVAVGTSVIDPEDPAVTGFHRVLARDGGDVPPSPDLAARAPHAAEVPVAGVLLTHGQHEYGERRLHGTVAQCVTGWLAGTDCARVAVESRLDTRDGLLCATDGQFLSLLPRLDVLVTDRLHGLVLGLRARVPVLAVDPVRGGAKVTAQARVCRWPAVIAAERLEPERLDAWWSWCLTDGREAARRRSRAMRAAEDTADRLAGVLADRIQGDAGVSAGDTEADLWPRPHEQ
ncbi:polysaccharide pyruvyl transferase family protein [Streptomyces sp. ACA25]|uniref:polysaccharide pyruvyl transferase family protein n=1 Tax=Streptomyces sp. ACA25 TaxID=3022596 RepID=UPI002306E061|nr:polysaccharide pyruvyl transferase family protein [Streptomyces sp. ACA25]MDB1087844.1 polysaccharide pyruvyl transferase family protein [Streptomyces sp. ACA25]